MDSASGPPVRRHPAILQPPLSSPNRALSSAFFPDEGTGPREITKRLISTIPEQVSNKRLDDYSCIGTRRNLFRLEGRASGELSELKWTVESTNVSSPGLWPASMVRQAASKSGSRGKLVVDRWLRVKVHSPQRPISTRRPSLIEQGPIACPLS